MDVNFNIEAHLHNHKDDEKVLLMIFQELEKAMAHLEALSAAVTSNTAVVSSAITLIQGLATKLEELKNDPAAIQALADELSATDAALAAAIAANTPAAPPV